MLAVHLLRGVPLARQKGVPPANQLALKKSSQSWVFLYGEGKKNVAYFVNSNNIRILPVYYCVTGHSSCADMLVVELIVLCYAGFGHHAASYVDWTLIHVHTSNAP